MTDAVTTTAATPADTSAATPATTPAWYEAGIADPGLRDYVKNKGWDGLEATVKSYQGVEKLVGAPPDQILRLPRDGDTAAQRAMYARLGMPETADKYEMSVPEGLPVDQGYMDWARSAFHKHGLSAAQAKAITAEHNAFLLAHNEQASNDYNLNVAAEQKALEREWGAGYDRGMARASHASRALGFNDAVLDGIESAIGYGATIKLLADLGSKLGEDNFVNAEGKAAGFGAMLSPDEAKAQWGQMKMDPEFVKALTDKHHPAHKEAAAKQAKLFAIMYPEG